MLTHETGDAFCCSRLSVKHEISHQVRGSGHGGDSWPETTAEGGRRHQAGNASNSLFRQQTRANLPNSLDTKSCCYNFYGISVQYRENDDYFLHDGRTELPR